MWSTSYQNGEETGKLRGEHSRKIGLIIVKKSVSIRGEFKFLNPTNKV